MQPTLQPTQPPEVAPRQAPPQGQPVQSEIQSQQPSQQRVTQPQGRGTQAVASGQPATQHPPAGGGGQLQPGRPQAGGVGTSPAGVRLLEPTTLDDVVQTDVYTAERDTPISTIVEDMGELQVGTAVVVENETPIGLITDRKITLALATIPDLLDASAAELIDGEVVSAMEGTDVFEVLDTMSEEGIRRVPVVDEEGRLAGIVALDDILLLLQSKLDTVAATIRAQFPRT